MKKRLISLFLFGLAAFVAPTTLLAQGQGLYFNGINQHAEFTAPSNLPSGSAPRTIEFWMKSDLRTGATGNHEAIIELGEQAHNGSAFGIYSQVSGGKTQLCFWGNSADKANIGEIPDDQWHFVAITYNAPNIQCYIDGELKSTNSIVALNTKVGKCYIGGLPSRSWYFKGAVDNLAIWNTVRTGAQIKLDMIPSPCLQGNEAGLVAHFRLDEGSGTTTKSSNNTVTATLKNGTAWTKAIQENPDPISEGIWFVIQNKSDVDTDLDVPARRLAFRSNGTAAPTMAQVPLAGNFDEFLWRAAKLTDGSGRYKLFNKKLGETKALDCSLQNPTVGNSGAASGQQWMLENSNLANHGTNVYTMTNAFITNTKALQYANGAVTVIAKNANDTKQAWVFQPIKLVAGYHIPTTTYDNCPTTKKLAAKSEIPVYGTNTSSDWSMLNTQLIIKNMVNSLGVPSSTLNGQRLYVISRYDYNPDLISAYPLVGIPSAWIGDTRGGQHPGHNLTMVTEEMMCRLGVYSRRNQTPPDLTYREFDQVVHEFGHTVDVFCSQNGGSTPACVLVSPTECYAASTQAWFNNNFSYTDYVRNRPLLYSNQRPLYDYIARAFKSSNTWLPPRKLWEIEPEKIHSLNSGTDIPFGTKAFYSNFENYYLTFQADGNLVVKNSGNDGFKWGSYNNMNIPTTGKKLRFENGFLIFKDAANKEVGRLGVNAPNSKLILSSDSNPASGSFLKVVDIKGNIVWTSN